MTKLRSTTTPLKRSNTTKPLQSPKKYPNGDRNDLRDLEDFLKRHEFSLDHLAFSVTFLKNFLYKRLYTHTGGVNPNRTDDDMILGGIYTMFLDLESYLVKKRLGEDDGQRLLSMLKGDFIDVYDGNGKLDTGEPAKKS
jgi:hypothetical protein